MDRRQLSQRVLVFGAVFGIGVGWGVLEGQLDHTTAATILIALTVLVRVTMP